MRLFSAATPQEDGFTLIEALIAMAVLSIGIFSLYSMQMSSIQNNSKASNITIASNWATEMVEQVLSMPYDDLNDTNSIGTSNGTDQDTSAPFGIDDDGGDFGLDAVTAATSDYNQTSSDGNYSIFWNVAIDHPIAGSKTVRVHVQDNNRKMNNFVTIRYIKEGPI